MNGRMEARVEPVETPAEAFGQESPALTPPPRDPALGIILAVILSAVLWPALLLLWLYFRR